MSVTRIRKSQLENLAIVDADIAAGAAIATSKLADASVLVKKNVTNVFSAAQDLGNNKIINLGTPTNANDAARLVDVQNAQAGLTAKASVRVIATSTMSTLSGLLSIDAVDLVAGDRVLLQMQTDKKQNGIWVVNVGAWTRPTDFAGSNVKAGTYVFVTEGITFAQTGWILSTDGTIVVDTTAIDFQQFTGAGQLTAGQGLVKNGNTIYIPTSGTLEIGEDSINIKTAGTAGTYTKVTTDAYGRVTSALTAGATGARLLSDYGIADAQANNANLTAIAGISTNGILTRVGSAAVVARTITAGSGIGVTSGDGVSGNPTISLSVVGTVGTFNSVTTDAFGRVTGGTNYSYIEQNRYIVCEVPAGTMNGTNAVFTLANSPIYSKEMVFLNGVLQDSGATNDYSLSGNTITFQTAPLATDKIRVTYIF